MKLGYFIVYVEDLLKTINFYEKAFGLKTRFINQRNQYAEMENEKGFIVLAFADEHYLSKHCISDFRKNKNGTIPAGFEIAFVTQNIDFSLQQALNSGPILMVQPTQKHWARPLRMLPI